ncbi:hypothetical protein N7453_001656 [Penicillium expansum]|nr:hypothetical protein N7453_001656 [Penicillium expansum]
MVLLGRKTGDVKIRELRVNGVEVENAKKVMPQVRSPGNYQEGQLAEKMYKQLSKFLSKHMIPTSVVPMKSMPLTVSKKVDRQQLEGRLSDMS